jgi:uncharacterized protein YqhQ
MTTDRQPSDEGAKSALAAFQAGVSAPSEGRPRRVLYGGQAVMEGVMIRGQTRAALAVRRPDGAIALRSLPLESWANGRARQIPLTRGALVLIETLLVGMKALSLSAAIAAPAGPVVAPTGPVSARGQGDQGAQRESGEVKPVSKLAMAVLLTVAIGLGFALFFLLPLFVSRLVEPAGDFLANVAEGGLRLVIFLAYIWGIGRMKEIKRVFGYHGAEHMAVSAFERGEPMTVNSLRRFPTAHPRCGTSFLLTVVLVSVVVFMFVPREPFWLLFASRIVLVPLIAAVSYELIRYSGLHLDRLWVRVMSWPNLLMQSMTTRQPDEPMLEVAIEAMNYAVALDEGRVPGAGTSAARNAGPDRQ